MDQFPNESIDGATDDVAQQKLMLADDVFVWPTWQATQRVYQIELRKQRRFYQLGIAEYTFLSLLNGDRTIASACGLAAAELAERALSIGQCETIANWMIQERIATVDSGISDPGVSSSRSTNAPGSWLQQLNPFWIRIPLLRNPTLIDRITRPFYRLVHPPVLVVLTILIAIAAVLFEIHYDAVVASAADFFSPSGWIAYLGTWVVLKIIHEFGHMLACRRVGGETSEIGVVFILFAPLAYVDVSSCWRMSRRMDRVFVSLAGMFIELAIASVAMVAWINTSDPSLRYYLSNIIITAGISTLLFNANPLMRFDGYYVVSDLVQIPNLYAEGSRTAGRAMQRLFFGCHERGQRYRGRRLWFLLIYGCLAFVWRVFVCTSLCLAASVLFSGAGVVIAVLGLFLWLRNPTQNFLSEIVRHWQQDRFRLVRCSVLFSVGTAAIVGLTLCPAPSPVVVAGVVSNPADSLVRTGANGFVRQVSIRNGQTVRKGDRLLTLDNDHLIHQLNQLQFDLSEKEVELRIATDQHDAAAVWLLRSDCKNLERQIDQLLPRVSALQVVAPCDGMVQSRELHLLEGTFVTEGTEIAHVVRDHSIEIRGMVQQNRVAFARSQVGHEVVLRDPARNQYGGRISAIDPRATHTLREPALSATIGGPLDVLKQGYDKQDRESVQEHQSPLRLATPHFVVRVELLGQESKRLKSGMRVWIDIGNRRDPIAQRITSTLETLVYQTKAAMRR